MTEPTRAETTEHLIAAARVGDAEALGRLLNDLSQVSRLFGTHAVAPASAGQSRSVGRGARGLFGGRIATSKSFVGLRPKNSRHGFVRFFRTSSRCKYESTLGHRSETYVWSRQSIKGSITHQDSCIQESQPIIARPVNYSLATKRFLQLAGALEELPEDYRQVIVLRHVEGLPFAEVAKLMDRSVDSVEKLWVRGLAKLKTLIKDA